MRKERKKYQPHDAFTDAIRGAVVPVHYNQRRDSVPTDSRRVALVSLHRQSLRATYLSDLQTYADALTGDLVTSSAKPYGCPRLKNWSWECGSTKKQRRVLMAA
jgi:hypothetical protein